MSASPKREASVADKLDALRVETKLKHQAIRDTQVRNHYLHKQVSDLHGQLEQCDREAKVEEEQIERLKKKLVIERAADRSAADLLEDHTRMVEEGGEGLEHRLATHAVLERNGIPIGRPVSLTTLEEVSRELEKELAATREEHEVVDLAFQRLTDRKAVIETDIKKQLARNERLNKELAKCKSIIKKNASLARDENTQVIQLERKLRAVQDSIDSIRSEKQVQEKHNKRLSEKLSGYRNEMQSMQSQKNLAKNKAVDEASVSEEREKWIAQLRDENKKMVDFLILDQNDATAGGRIIPDDEEGDFDALEDLLQSRKVAEAKRRGLSPSATAGHRSKSATRKDPYDAERMLTENKLLHDLQDAIAITQDTATASKQHANKRLKETM